MLITKEELAKQLKETTCEVVFTKTDGSERVMKCSLQSDVLKPYLDEIEKRNKQLLMEGKEIKQKPENPNLIAVIDVENNGWRSIKLDTIKSVKAL
jgi:hypothetical protein